MTHEHFDKFLQECVDQYVKEAKAKGTEYANNIDGEDDRLANFYAIAKALGTDPMKVAWTYITKHIRAVEYAIRTGGTLSESMDSRLHDIGLYTILLRAILEDRRLQEKKNTPALPPKYTIGAMVLVTNHQHEGLSAITHLRLTDDGYWYYTLANGREAYEDQLK